MPKPRLNPALVTALALLLLLLPSLYVGSYLTLVVPAGRIESVAGAGQKFLIVSHYRWGGNSFASRFFWPLQQVDRKLRPKAWGPFFFNKGYGHVEMELGP
jgi:hypothetical protein